jgi:DNA excision repair protein ERCC-3
VLKHNRYFVESGHADILQILLKDEIIGPLRIETEEGTSEQGLVKDRAPRLGDLVIPGTGQGKDPKVSGQNGENASGDKDKSLQSADDLFTAVVGIDRGNFTLISYFSDTLQKTKMMKQMLFTHLKSHARRLRP